MYFILFFFLGMEVACMLSPDVLLVTEFLRKNAISRAILINIIGCRFYGVPKGGRRLLCFFHL